MAVGRVGGDDEPEGGLAGALAAGGDPLGGGVVESGEPRLVDGQRGLTLLHPGVRASAARSQQTLDALERKPASGPKLNTIRST